MSSILSASKLRLSLTVLCRFMWRRGRKEPKTPLIGAWSLALAVTLEKLDRSQHFTQPPAHYTEASLVKALEEQGNHAPVPMRQRLPPLLPEDTWQKKIKTFT